MNIVSKAKVLLDRRDGIKFVVLFLLIIIGAALETVGISLIIPVVNLLINPDFIKENDVIRWLYSFFRFKSEATFAFGLGIGVLIFYFLKNAYLAFMYYAQYRIVFNTQLKVSKSLFGRYLRMPYEEYLSLNSSVLLRIISNDIPNTFSNVILPFLLFITELMVIGFIIFLLLWIDPLITPMACTLIGLGSSIFYLFFKKRVKGYGDTMQLHSGDMIKAINQGFGGFKEIRVNKKEEMFIQEYYKQNQCYIKALRSYQTISQIPRFTVETIVIMSVLLIAFIMVTSSADSARVTAVLAVYTMAAFRLMPSINRINGYLSTITAYKPSLDIVSHDWERLNKNLESENMEAPKQNFYYQANDEIQEIVVNDLSYRYPDNDEWALQNVSLSIPIGATIGIIGPSGSGKTTFVDLMLGILNPSAGTISALGYNIHKNQDIWAKIVGYIPQTIYLNDDTIRANIAFGVPKSEVDEAKVWESLEKAQLKVFVNSLELGLDTTVGERGIRLSGGQRQRIGIARALYENPKVLVLDEATSALDSETESEVMNAIDDLKGSLTIIIIAHRLSTIKNCDAVIEIKDGKVERKSNSA